MTTDSETTEQYLIFVRSRFLISVLVVKKIEEFLTLTVSWPWPWIGSYGISSCITHQPLPTYQISLESDKLFWTDGRTYLRTDVRMDGHLRPILLGRLFGVDLKMAIANGTCVSWVRPLNNRGKCHMEEKRIQCLSNASQHVPIYLQPFTSYSETLVGNCNFYLPLAFNAPIGGDPDPLGRSS